MICERCAGTGMVTYTKHSGLRRRAYSWQEVCPECGGQQFTHCCEGERPTPQQPEPPCAACGDDRLLPVFALSGDQVGEVACPVCAR